VESEWRNCHGLGGGIRFLATVVMVAVMQLAVSHAFLQSGGTHAAVRPLDTRFLPALAARFGSAGGGGTTATRRELGALELSGGAEGTLSRRVSGETWHVAEEADECLDWLEYFRDGSIQHDPALIEEARALTKIFATCVRTARRNTNRMKNPPPAK